MRLLLALSLLLAAPAWATTYYVDQGLPGSDSNAGTSAGAPWLTFMKAVQTASAGDLVIVKAGVYIDPNGAYDKAFSPAHSGTAANPIVFQSSPRWAAILRPSGADGAYSMLIAAKDYITIDGFRSEGALGAQGSDKTTPVRGIVLKNCEVVTGRPSQSDPSTNWGLALIQALGGRMTNNYVHDIVSSGNNSHNTAAVMIFQSDSCIIENNDANCANGSNLMSVYSSYGQKGGKIKGNTYRNNIARNGFCGFLGMGSTDAVYWSESNDYYSNIVINAATSAWEFDHETRFDRIHNNTTYNCRAFIQANYTDIDNIQFTSYNNIMANTYLNYGTSDLEYANSPSGYHRSGIANFSLNLLALSNYNCFVPGEAIAMHNYGSTVYTSLSSWRSAYPVFDANSIASLPGFVDSAGGDFHLSAASPCRGAGQGGVDMGAYPNGTGTVGPDYSTQGSNDTIAPSVVRDLRPR
jgi:hypothetical protein